MHWVTFKLITLCSSIDGRGFQFCHKKWLLHEIVIRVILNMNAIILDLNKSPIELSNCTINYQIVLQMGYISLVYTDIRFPSNLILWDSFIFSHPKGEHALTLLF